MSQRRNSNGIWELVEAKRGKFFALSDTIWGIPELNYEEYKSSEEQARALEDEGFTVSRGVAGLPTALMAEAGAGGPVIALLGEFDALPDLSQEAGVAEHRPVSAGGAGHACGHNLLGVGSMQAAVALRDFLAKEGIPGGSGTMAVPPRRAGQAKDIWPERVSSTMSMQP